MKQKNAKEFSIKDLERGLNDCTKSVEEYEKKFGEYLYEIGSGMSKFNADSGTWYDKIHKWFTDIYPYSGKFEVNYEFYNKSKRIIPSYNEAGAKIDAFVKGTEIEELNKDTKELIEKKLEEFKQFNVSFIKSDVGLRNPGLMFAADHGYQLELEAGKSTGETITDLDGRGIISFNNQKNLTEQNIKWSFDHEVMHYLLDMPDLNPKEMPKEVVDLIKSPSSDSCLQRNLKDGDKSVMPYWSLYGAENTQVNPDRKLGKPDQYAIKKLTSEEGSKKIESYWSNGNFVDQAEFWAFRVGYSFTFSMA